MARVPLDEDEQPERSWSGGKMLKIIPRSYEKPIRTSEEAWKEQQWRHYVCCFCLETGHNFPLTKTLKWDWWSEISSNISQQQDDAVIKASPLLKRNHQLWWINRKNCCQLCDERRRLKRAKRCCERWTVHHVCASCLTFQWQDCVLIRGVWTRVADGRAIPGMDKKIVYKQHKCHLGLKST